MKDYGFTTESDIATISKFYTHVHDSLADSVDVGKYPYNVRELLMAQLEKRNKTTRFMDAANGQPIADNYVASPHVGNDIFLAPTNDPCLRMLNDAQVSFWRWYTEYVNGKTPGYFTHSHMNKLKVYHYYTCRVVDELTRLNGDFLTLNRDEAGNTVNISSLAGEIVVEPAVEATVDPLDLFHYFKETELVEAARQILRTVHAADVPEQLSLAIALPAKKSTREKISIYLDKERKLLTIRLVRYSIRIVPETATSPPFTFICFDDIHRKTSSSMQINADHFPPRGRESKTTLDNLNNR